MCLLIALLGVDRDYPVLVASNRDELRTRKSSPPGLFCGATHRMLSPRDRVAGGTWMAVNERGLFAGLTNLPGPTPEGARSRGRLPHLALDGDTVAAGAGAVAAAVGSDRFAGFQLLITDGADTVVVEHDAGELETLEIDEPVVVLSNDHHHGELELPGIEAALAAGLEPAERLDALAPLLLDRGDSSGHRVLKVGGEYGTVSSSLIAVPRADPRELIWRYAPGSPDTAEYRNYGNLGRRLAD